LAFPIVRRRIYISDYIGLCNRLESLPLSFAIEEKFGHQVCLDWPELDAFTVEGTVRRKMGLLDRIGKIKVRECNRELFDTLGKYRTVILRGMDGPDDLLTSWYLKSAQRLRLLPRHIETIRQTFAKYQGRPVVGVHIRRGDFILRDADEYDVAWAKHQAIPLWWYDHVMTQLVKCFPDVCFFLSCTGDSGEYRAFHQKFEVFEMPVFSPYDKKGPDHQSARHPVTDLFALASCSVIIATPKSSFSHYAAHALGMPSTAILPPPRTNRNSPAYGYVQFYGQRLPAWSAVSKQGTGLILVEDESKMPKPASPDTDWM